MTDSILHKRVSNWVIVVILLLIAGLIALIWVDGRRDAERMRKVREVLAYYKQLGSRLRHGDKTALLELADNLESGHYASRAQDLCIEFVEGRKPLQEAALARWVREQYPYLEYDRSSEKYRHSEYIHPQLPTSGKHK